VAAVNGGPRRTCNVFDNGCCLTLCMPTRLRTRTVRKLDPRLRSDRARSGTASSSLVAKAKQISGHPASTAAARRD
jgi:hypothetical protein